MKESFGRQMKFLVEIDRMKSIYRQTILIDESRRETDAEHSWHFAVMAITFAEYAPAGTDLDRVVRMALAHDLVEIYAGDTYAYDDAGNATKKERELASAERLFALLPEAQGAEFRALWDEFEAEESPEAKFANAIDCLQPFVNNYMTNGKSWMKHGADAPRVYARMERVKRGAPDLYPWVVSVLEEAVQKGYLKR